MNKTMKDKKKFSLGDKIEYLKYRLKKEDLSIEERLEIINLFENLLEMTGGVSEKVMMKELNRLTISMTQIGK